MFSINDFSSRKEIEMAGRFTPDLSYQILSPLTANPAEFLNAAESQMVAIHERTESNAIQSVLDQKKIELDHRQKMIAALTEQLTASLVSLAVGKSAPPVGPIRDRIDVETDSKEQLELTVAGLERELQRRRKMK